MALQPPGGSGLQLAPLAGPDRGSGMPLELIPTPRAKRCRDTPLTAKGLLNVSGAATGSILVALNE
ncbi:hypothetical protein CMUS01_13363 [Colletotrichum musicola]|uniref:Uncharacterized protein n=1 Tax=Colletotrichum musicola TaxID=2175873 RepID=A0A8H6JD98_9PEZI|nr:hypothetical protein CMUS01_13363 [Colletotrichum musicola]